MTSVTVKSVNAIDEQMFRMPLFPDLYTAHPQRANSAKRYASWRKRTAKGAKQQKGSG
jgi:hypothetical protein